LLALGLAGLVRSWLENWQDLTISLLGQEIARVDLVQFLGLDGVLEISQTLASASGLVLALAVLALALVSGFLLAMIVILVGLAYNLLASATGGVVVEMHAVKEQSGAE
jgi:Na+-translocating ferredoxin:NAD+ oxidoreductase RnfA subunit